MNRTGLYTDEDDESILENYPMLLVENKNAQRKGEPLAFLVQQVHNL